MGWQVTAKTILCDLVGEQVTIMVYGDGTTRCPYYDKYVAPGEKKLKKQKPKSINCNGPSCSYIVEYRDELLRGEAEKAKG